MSEALDFLGILEVMGHQRYAGFITEQSVGPSALIRVDVPQIGESLGFTKFFSPSSIFAITPMTEEASRYAAATFKSRPIELFALPGRGVGTSISANPSLPYRDDDFDEDCDS